MNLKNKIKVLLIEKIEEQNLYLDEPIDLSQGNDSYLYSDDGQLDSLSLISIISDIEKKLFEWFEVNIKLASELDLSVKNSPFSTFGSTIDFILERVETSTLVKSA